MAALVERLPDCDDCDGADEDGGSESHQDKAQTVAVFTGGAGHVARCRVDGRMRTWPFVCRRWLDARAVGPLRLQPSDGGNGARSLCHGAAVSGGGSCIGTSLERAAGLPRWTQYSTFGNVQAFFQFFFRPLGRRLDQSGA